MSTAPAIKESLMETWPDTLRSLRAPAKIIAFKMKVTERAIEKQAERKNLPSLALALAMGREYPEIRELLNRYMSAQSDFEEDPMRVLYEMHQKMGILLERAK